MSSPSLAVVRTSSEGCKHSASSPLEHLDAPDPPVLSYIAGNPRRDPGSDLTSLCLFQEQTPAQPHFSRGGNQKTFSKRLQDPTRPSVCACACVCMHACMHVCICVWIHTVLCASFLLPIEARLPIETRPCEGPGH